MTNVEALEETLVELGRMGRIEPIDTAMVQLARTQAASLDVRPGNSQMTKEYRETLEVLTARGDDSTDSIRELLEQLHSPVRDSPPA